MEERDFFITGIQQVGVGTTSVYDSPCGPKGTPDGLYQEVLPRTLRQDSPFH